MRGPEFPIKSEPRRSNKRLSGTRRHRHAVQIIQREKTLPTCD